MTMSRGAPAGRSGDVTATTALGALAWRTMGGYCDVMGFDKSASAGYLVNHLARLFAREIHAQISPLGLSPGTFPAMLELWASDGLTQRDLVARLDIEQATMANTLSRMERDGLIHRTPDPEDKRARRVWLTEHGRALQAPATEAARAVNHDALASLGEDERRAFLATLRRLVAQLQAQRAPRGEP